MNGKMLSRTPSRRHKWCDECIDPACIRPWEWHDVDHLPRWKGNFGRRGYVRSIRKMHTRALRAEEKALVRREIEEELRA